MGREGAKQRSDRDLAVSTAEVESELEAQARQRTEQDTREQMIAQCHEVIGRVQGLQFIEKVTTVGTLMQLKQIKESKAYRDLPNIGTWEDFCKYIGLSRQKVDEDLTNLAAFGEEFLLTVGRFSLGYRELRKLRMLTHDGTLQVEDGTITIDGETIPVDEEHAPEVEAAVSALLEKHTALSTRVEKLEKNLDACVKEETKGLQQEKKALLAENKRLQAFAPEEHDETWCEEQMAEIDKACAEFSALCRKFIVDPRLDGDRAAQAQVLRYMDQTETELQDVRSRFESAYRSGE